MTKTRPVKKGTNQTGVLRASVRLGQYGRIFNRKPRPTRWNEYEPY